MTIRVGILGCGKIARLHAHGYKQAPDLAQVVVCCDEYSVELAQKLAQEFPGAGVTNRWQEVIERSDVDAISICLPPYQHALVALAAAAAGKHVLVEKPMAATLADATEMVRTARQSGKLLMCALKTRYSDDIMAAKRIIASGELGDIYYAETVAARRRGIPGGSFVRQASAGLGATADIGVYALDTALHLMGHPTPIAVSAITNDAIGKTHLPPAGSGWRWSAEALEVEEFGVAWIRFANGAVLVLKTTWAMHLDDIGGTFFLGPKAGLRLTPELKVYRDEWGYLADIAPQAKPTPDVEMFRREIDAFYQAIRAGHPAPIAPEGVLLTNVIIDGMIASAKQGGREVEVAVPDLA